MFSFSREISPHFVETVGLGPPLKAPRTCPCLEPHQTSPDLHILLLEDLFEFYPHI
jgi:hypothetical protein